MGHSLLKIAHRVERRANARRMKMTLNAALTDRRLAEDIGLPHRPDPVRFGTLWYGRIANFDH